MKLLLIADNDLGNNVDIHLRTKRSVQSYHYQNQYNQRQSHRHQRHNQLYNGLHNGYNNNHYPRRHNDKPSSSSSRHQDSHTGQHKKYQLMEQKAENIDQYHYQVYQQHQQKQTPYITGNLAKEYTIEVLVAVDRKMREYHGENLQSYVLTLMSIVSIKIFHIYSSLYGGVTHEKYCVAFKTIIYKFNSSFIILFIPFH